MLASENAYQLAIVEFQNAGPSGLSKRIVQVAYLRAVEDGTSPWSWLEETISRFRRGITTTYKSFAASASFARAIAHYGVVEGRPLRECLVELDPLDANFSYYVATRVDQVDRAQASRSRRASGARADGSRWGDTYPVYRSVQTLLDSAGKGDQKAIDEIEMIRSAISF